MTAEQVKAVIREYADLVADGKWKVASITFHFGIDEPAETLVVFPKGELTASSLPSA